MKTNTTTKTNLVVTVKTSMSGQPSFCFYNHAATAPRASTAFERIIGTVCADTWDEALRQAEAIFYNR